MRFRRSSDESPPASSRLRSQILGWLAVGVVILIAVQLVRTAQQRETAERKAAPKAAVSTEETADLGSVPEPFDDRAAENGPDLGAAPSSTPAPRPADVGPDVGTAAPPPVAQDFEGSPLPTSPPPVASVEEPAPTEMAADEWLREETAIDRQVLAPVVDNTFGLRAEEVDPLARVLAHSLLVPVSFLARAARRDILYENVMATPDHYRGELLSVRGELRRLARLTAPPNAHDLKQFYEGWVISPGSSNRPWKVYFSQAPEGIAPGDRLRVPVEVHGYFFKNVGYESPSGLLLAPVLVGRQISPYRVDSTPPVSIGWTPYALVGLGTAFVMLCLVLLSFTVSDMQMLRHTVLLRNASSVHEWPPLTNRSDLYVTEYLEKAARQADPVPEDPVDIDDFLRSRSDRVVV